MTSAGESDEPARLSVLICSRGRPGLLLDTVGSVLAGDVVPEELLVVDQSATANAELAGMDKRRGCRILYLHSATTGLSRARNIGLRAASRDVVALIDDDMFVDPGWLSELLGGLPDLPKAVATGRVLAAPPEGAAGTVPPAALVERDTPAVYRGFQPLDVVPGANVAVPRELVLTLGGYDERLGAGTRFCAADDNDMGHRLMRAGCEVHHVPSAIVLHRAWRTKPELLRLRWGYGRGKGAFYAKHASLRDRLILRRAGADVRRRLGQAAAAALRISPRDAAAELISLVGMVSGALDWIIGARVRDWVRRFDR